MTQSQFGIFVEDRLSEIAKPEASQLLGMIRNFAAKKDVTFQSAIRQDNGSIAFAYNEAVVGQGMNGNIPVPAEFSLVLQPYKDFAQIVFSVTARLRYRIEGGGKLSLWYELVRVDEVADLAFAKVVDQIRAETVDSVRAVLKGTA